VKEKEEIIRLEALSARMARKIKNTNDAIELAENEIDNKKDELRRSTIELRKSGIEE
jgi:hypothetical protein